MNETRAKTTASAAAPAARLEFSEQARERIRWIFGRYPTRQAALLPVLRVAEEEFGGIGPAAIECVAREMELSPGLIYGVFTFYTHFRREGDGKHVIEVCSTLSCALRGCRDLVHRIEDRLGIAPGETTADGRFTLKKVECLASCDTAPVIQVNGEYHEGLTVEKLDEILDGLEGEKEGKRKSKNRQDAKGAKTDAKEEKRSAPQRAQSSAEDAEKKEKKRGRG